MERCRLRLECEMRLLEISRVINVDGGGLSNERCSINSAWSSQFYPLNTH